MASQLFLALSQHLVSHAPAAVVYDEDTAEGEKKNTTRDLPDEYSPAYVECVWADWWVKSRFFKHEQGLMSDGKSKKFFTSKKFVLWNRALDHAGVATQIVVEKLFKKEQDLGRHYYSGTAEYKEKIKAWQLEYGDAIVHQLQRFGCTMDWDRAYYLQPSLSTAVTEAFVYMHKQGDIYRENSLVNWSCTLKRAISDIEVDKVELPGRTMLSVPGYKDEVEFGVLVSFAYKVSGSDEEVVVATTRLETMLGDTAVAVHPDDARYKHLHGKNLVHPFFPCSRKLPVVADDTVQMDSGTGAVKIAPAHDPKDHELGVKHGLQVVNIFTDGGDITDSCRMFSGMKRFEARKAVTAELEKLGLYRGKVDHPMVLQVCSRSRDIVEPHVRPQWFVRGEVIKNVAREVTKNRQLRFVPEQLENDWSAWIDGLGDWCISRQLRWGHRIPAYLMSVKNSITPPDPTLDFNWVSGRTVGDALDEAAKRLKTDESRVELVQDEDVLDSWFSSMVIPWLHEKRDSIEYVQANYLPPTDKLDLFCNLARLGTNHDVLFFWASRMIFGQKLAGKLPFKQIVLQDFAKDVRGHEMSHLLGTVIDPLDVVRTLDGHRKTQFDDCMTEDDYKEMVEKDYPRGTPKYGTDALRFALCSYNSQGNLDLDVLLVRGYTFCENIWTASILAMRYLGEGFLPCQDGVFGLEKANGPFALEPLPPAGQMKEATALAKLELVLKVSPYLAGDHPAQVDAEAFAALRGVSLQGQLSAWYDNMNALTANTRKKLPRGEGSHVKVPQPTPLSHKDRWILSRLSECAAACNDGFVTYNFPKVTTALFNFWSTEFHDDYLKSIKSVFEGSDNRAIFTSMHVIWCCLEAGFCLISPVMPFIAEELYQRLPVSAASAASVTVARYPSNLPFRDTGVEAVWFDFQ